VVSGLVLVGSENKVWCSAALGQATVVITGAAISNVEAKSRGKVGGKA